MIWPRYCIITPCRDEAEFARKTLESVTTQTVPPSLWIIVDDGSKDETPNILADYAKMFPYIRVIRREDRGRRSVGPGVVDAFYAGYETIDPKQFDYICKLDLDLILPPRYFETLMERMEANGCIGTASGKPYFVAKGSGQLVSEKISDEMSVGASKFYRVSCFQDIGGFVRQVMWDGIDCHRARMNGWIACSWDEPDLRFIHLRPMGASDGNILRGRIRWGFGQYFMGTSAVYMLVASLYRLTRPPRILGGVCMIWGYLSSWLTRVPRYEDKEFRRFLRKYQLRCLVIGKAKATAELHAHNQQKFEDRRMSSDLTTPATGSYRTVSR
jgi:glycosyltransferase involved in cell wall biosynthesis